jgi:hypothetical protein
VVSATIFDWLYHAVRFTWHDPEGYNFISGPLADITLLGGGYAILRRHNCHAKRCFRIGRRPVAGTTYVVCRRHHPDDTPTAEQIYAAHSAHRRTLAEAQAAGADIRHVAHDVATDVHRVAEDVHEAESSGPERPPPGGDPE